MARKRFYLDQETFSCSICLDSLKEPVTTSCGHSFCKNCIKSHWDTEDRKIFYSCPQCRKKFMPRPVLEKNTILAALVEELKKSGPPAAPPMERSERQKDLEVRHLKIRQKTQDRMTDLRVLQEEVEAINRSADEAVEGSEEVFIALIRLIERRRRDVKQQVRSQQEAKVSRVNELKEKLEQEITELKRQGAELEEFSHTEDQNQFLHNPRCLSALRGSPHSSSISVRPLICFQDVTAAVSKVKERLQDVLREELANISHTEVDVLRPELEPMTRAGFLRYAHEITLDPNTAHKCLLLSEGNRKITRMDEDQIYSRHPDRFTYWPQVLSRESLTGCCYWEVERRGGGVCLAITDKNISRAGDSHECWFGLNEKSWVLDCDTKKYLFWFNSVSILVSGPQSSRVGVFLDCDVGVLSFYSVSGDTMTLLHRVQTTFPQPLHAGLALYHESSAEFCEVR